MKTATKHKESIENTIGVDSERLMTETEAAGFLGVTRRALQQWRLNGNGPKYVKISQRCVRYRRIELIKWSEERLRSSTSEKIDVIEGGSYGR